jgi:hypothetical protein
MKLYLFFLALATLTFAYGQAGGINTVIIHDCSNSKSIPESEISPFNEKLSSSPFNNQFVFGNENTISSVVEVISLIIKDKLTQNNHHVLFNTYKFYLQHNILANNSLHYKKLFHKLCILQI